MEDFEVRDALENVISMKPDAFASNTKYGYAMAF